MSNPSVVLITGGAKRVGAAIARHLHQCGHRILVHYRESKKLAEELVSEFNHLRPDSAAGLHCDFMNIDHYPDFIAKAASVWSELDVIINNASEYFPTVVGETTQEQWQRLMISNLQAPYFLVQAALPYLKKNKLSQIINITDAKIVKPPDGFCVYYLAKSGLTTLTRLLAKELAPNILVNALALGNTLWPEYLLLTEHERQQKLQESALKKLVNLQDVVNAVDFLLSQSSVTGEILTIDSGWSV